MSAESPSDDSPHFGRGVPPVGASGRWRWVRVQAGGEVECVSLTSLPWWFDTHHIDGHTLGCLGPECPRWLHKTGVRQRIFLAVAMLPPRPVWLLEVGAPAQPILERALAALGTLHGRKLLVRKEGERAKSPVILTVLGPHPQAASWGAEPDVGAYLRRLWAETIAARERAQPPADAERD